MTDSDRDAIQQKPGFSEKVKNAVADIAKHTPGHNSDSYTRQALDREGDFLHAVKSDSKSAKPIARDDSIGVVLVQDIKHTFTSGTYAGSFTANLAHTITPTQREAVHALADGQEVNGKRLSPADVDQLMNNFQLGLLKAGEAHTGSIANEFKDQALGEKLRDESFNALAEAIQKGVDAGYGDPTSPLKTPVVQAATVKSAVKKP
jgi:hypothetical protein